MKKKLFTKRIVAKLNGEHSAAANASVPEYHVPITEIPLCRNKIFDDMMSEGRVSKRVKAVSKDDDARLLRAEKEVVELRKELSKSNKKNWDLSIALASAKSATVKLKKEVGEAKHAELHAREEWYHKGYEDGLRQGGPVGRC